VSSNTVSSNTVSDTYLNTDDAARFLGLSKQTLARWRVEGAGPPYRKLGSRVTYRRADLEAFAEGNTFDHTSQYDARVRRAPAAPSPFQGHLDALARGINALIEERDLWRERAIASGWKARSADKEL
jgi:hypothetical protein